MQIPAGALDVEGTEVNLEASEVSENELQFIVDNSSSAEAELKYLKVFHLRQPMKMVMQLS